MIELTLPWPPTVNTYYRRVGNRTLLSKNGRDYCKSVCYRAMAENWPRLGDKRLKIEIVAYPPDKRQRDLDNLLKGLLDSLQASALFDDDSQIDDLRIIRGNTVRDGRLHITLEETA